MAILKCKMCGDNIEVSADMTYGTCESCGSTMTLPKIDDDQRANLFNRANRFRQIGEFDKAISAYESILNHNDEDAEAHWCVVLSRYGIEYVVDPKTEKRVPTCHRLQTMSILTDPDYLAALEHTTDGYTRELYQKEAARISEIQKEIMAISANEAPYDVFICYKESDENGNRTKDSTLAQDVYYQLTQEGYKVFFARITLEDKLGTAYEPYIFAALNSAKVMIVVGSRQEYFNTIWVKNEWSRYLDLLAKDKSRLLIPCYRDMDAYDIPDALSMFQSQDMGKIGFVQDLIRGVKKVLVKDEIPIVQAIASTPGDTSITPGVTALLKRTKLFLEDGEWDNALAYCEKTLDLDAECAEAYLYRLCAKLNCKGIKKLPLQDTRFLQNKDCQKAIRFGGARLQQELQGYDKTIADRLKENRKASIYQEAVAAKGTKKYEIAIGIFQSILDYKDVKVQIVACEEGIKEGIYKIAISCKNSTAFCKAIEQFNKIPDYKDAKAQIEECQQLIKKKAEDAEKRKVEAEKHRAEIAQQEALEAKQRKKRNIVLAIVSGVAVACVCVYMFVISPMLSYNDATALMEQKLYDEARSAFLELGEYKDSADMANETMYIKATDLLEQGSCDVASAVFAELGNYKDSADMAKEAMYIKATNLLEEELYDEASVAFAELDDYKDSVSMAQEADYCKASDLLEQCAYDEAKQIFIGLDDYKDSESMAQETNYCKASDILDEENYSGAFSSFVKLGDYKNSEELLSQCLYFWVQENAKTVSAGATYNIGIKSDGTVVATEYTGDSYYGQCDIGDWTDIVSVATGGIHTVGLKSDGTVIATKNTGDFLDGQCEVGDWTDIVAISAGSIHTVGLKSDGTVVGTEYAAGWNDDGRCEVGDWADIVAISAGCSHTVGLKSNGTVVAVGDDICGQCEVDNWTDIAAISAGDQHTVGLKSDGTVVAVGNNNSGECDVDNWMDIVAISADTGYTIGLKSDGTVVAVGHNWHGKCDVDDWTDIVAISTGCSHTIGLKSDGTVVAVGDDYYGQCDVSDWTDIMIYD